MCLTDEKNATNVITIAKHAKRITRSVSIPLKKKKYIEAHTIGDCFLFTLTNMLAVVKLSLIQLKKLGFRNCPEATI